MEAPENCIVHMRTAQSSKFKTWIEALKDIIIQGNFCFTEKGLSVIAHTRTLYTESFIDAEKLDSYLCKREVIVGIDFTSLHTSLKNIKQNDILTIQITKKGFVYNTAPHLNIHIVNNSMGIKFHTKLKAIYIDESSVTNRHKYFDSVVCMPSQKFKSVITSMSVYSDHIQLLAKCGPSESNLYFVAWNQGADTSCTVEFNKNVNEIPDYDDVKRFECSQSTSDKKDVYPTKILCHISKASSLGVSVQIYLKNKDHEDDVDSDCDSSDDDQGSESDDEEFDGFPLVIRIKIGTIGFMMFYISPQKVDRCESISSLTGGELEIDKTLLENKGKSKSVKIDDLFGETSDGLLE